MTALDNGNPRGGWNIIPGGAWGGEGGGGNGSENGEDEGSGTEGLSYESRYFVEVLIYLASPRLFNLHHRCRIFSGAELDTDLSTS